MHEARLVVEPIEEELVVRTEQVEQEAVEGGPCGGHAFAFHAAARVEHDAEADRHALATEVRERLRHPVLVDEEVVLVQAGHETPPPVGDRGADVDQIDAGTEPERGPLGVLCDGAGGHGGNDAGQQGRQEKNGSDAGECARHGESPVGAGVGAAERRSMCGMGVSSRRKLIR